MIIGIDASNILTGGGLTHLINILSVSSPSDFGITKIIVWGGHNTIAQVPDRKWLLKSEHKYLGMNLVFRTWWQYFVLPRSARKMNCNIIYILGGVYISKFRPYVAISQNILPFDWQEIWQYRFSFNFYRFVLLRLFHVNTFRKADGLVVLTEFAKEKILKTVKSIKGSTALIPHGISCNFIAKPRVQKDICEFSKDQRFRILYASTIDHYKHQWNVVFAAEQLINKGYPIELEFVGGKYDPALIKLNRAITKIGINSQFIKYVGEIPYKRMHTKYIDANAFIFASSCENMPIILLEAMAAGLPIACSNRGPMPEVLGNAGVYFDPEDPGSIANSVELLLLNQHTRETIARDAYNRVQQYSWERCAKETLTYLAKVASNV